MTSNVSDKEWNTLLSEIIQSATSLFLNGLCNPNSPQWYERRFSGICILLAVQACYLLSRRRSSGWGVLVCYTVVACGFAIGQMIHQVVATAMLLGLHHSAETVQVVSEQQRLQESFQHLSEVKTQQCNIFLLANKFVVVFGLLGKSDFSAQFVHRRSFLFGIVSFSISWNPRVCTILVALEMITTNLFLTGLTAGRIWWIKRRLRDGTQLVQRYNTAITLLLESSAFYFAVILALAIVRLVGSPALLESPAVSVLRGSSPQVASYAIPQSYENPVYRKLNQS
ncbi:hypothetical protein B0H12DRAFT_1073562 [Mycena haematopus]|nr:hypothetical protein B0H12DRAFT_1073562 [Mycena haematopus]